MFRKLRVHSHMFWSWISCFRVFREGARCIFKLSRCFPKCAASVIQDVLNKNVVWVACLLFKSGLGWRCRLWVQLGYIYWRGSACSKGVSRVLASRCKLSSLCKVHRVEEVNPSPPSASICNWVSLMWDRSMGPPHNGAALQSRVTSLSSILPKK